MVAARRKELSERAQKRDDVRCSIDGAGGPAYSEPDIRSHLVRGEDGRNMPYEHTWAMNGKQFLIGQGLPLC